MNWIESCVYTTTEATEAVCAALAEAGVTGVQIEDAADLKNFLSRGGQWDYVDEALLNAPDGEARVKFYVSDNAHGRETLISAERAVMGLLDMETGLEFGRLRVETQVVDDGDWVNNWKKYYKPFNVGERIVIRPEWEEYDGGDKTVVTLNPGHVFGTGLHQSTQLCLERLESAILGGESVLDLGCGSGILSISAMLLGAKSALAVDIEPDAVEIAYGNAALNGIERPGSSAPNAPSKNYRVISGNAITDEALRADIRERKYDVVTANIVADIIIALTGLAEECTKPGGIFITSGIIRERAGDVRDALAKSFDTVSETMKDEWVCIVGRRKAETR